MVIHEEVCNFRLKSHPGVMYSIIFSNGMGGLYKYKCPPICNPNNVVDIKVKYAASQPFSFK